jgi:hypothetical protein
MSEHGMSSNYKLGIVGLICGTLLLLTAILTGHSCVTKTTRIRIEGPSPDVEKLMRDWVEAKEK